MERPCNQKEKIAKNYENNNWKIIAFYGGH